MSTEVQIFPKKLINSPATAVTDAVEGALLIDSRLKRVGTLNVLVRYDIDIVKASHVTIISGGGSGHEPAHAGFIGSGMLSGAVLGNVFASPSVSSILAAIRVCAGPKGVLLIIKNYTGDRLNFGMAMEKAKQEGIKVKMAIVEDDCALPIGKGITGGRGVAGTVFVHKIAGATAAAGADLEEVYARASAAAKDIGSLGVALSTCTVPGAPVSKRLASPTTIEVGMGIHGEPGREQRTIPETNAAEEIAQIMVEGILGSDAVATRLAVSSDDKLAVLLNNLGGLPVIEMQIVARGVMNELKKRGLRPVRAFVGPYMTSLEMQGISLSLFRIASDDAGSLLKLDYPTNAPGWVASPVLDLATANDPINQTIAYDPEALNVPVRGGFPCPQAGAIARAVSLRIQELEPILTEYDAVCGDGDCGLVMKAGATQILSDLETAAGSAALEDSAVFCDQLAVSISASMGGTSGALLEIFFRAMATSLASQGNVGEDSATRAAAWATAFQAGVEAMMFYGGATVGMRTLLDALVPAVAALQTGSMEDAVRAAKDGAETTKTMGSLAGRSNYISQEKMQGVPDPGAAAVAAAFAAAALAL